MDKINTLCKVADVAFKSQTKLPTMSNNDDVSFELWIGQTHRALQPILGKTCCDTYTTWKIEHSDISQLHVETYVV